MIESLYQKGFLLAAKIAAETSGTTQPPATGMEGKNNLTQVQIPGNLPRGDFNGVVTNVINWGLTMAGGITVLMLVTGGFLYITAAGDERRIERGKTVVRSAITGLIIILISAIIVNTLNYALFGSAGSGGS